MTEHPHEEIRRLFDMVLDAPAAQRESVLDRACAGDDGLKQRIRAMVAAAEDDQFLGNATGGGLDDVTIEAMPVHAPMSSPHESVGQVIGRYKLLEQIGEGGFGTVWMAEQREPVKRRVALKVIKLGMDTKQVIARFEAERQALAIMDHPSIAKVLDAGATETGRPYFVMELVRGQPITLYCDRKRLSIRERLELIEQVCDALQHAHQKGVIHRDIKPSNVLVADQGDRAMPKIIDFGIAKATTARLTEKTLFTEFRQMVGTPEYMSPEQAGESAEDTDTRTDVYSAGVLLYELITGLTPFDSMQLRSAAFGEIQRIIREVDPPKPSTRVSENGATLPSVAEHRHTEPRKLGVMIRGELDWIVMKAMEKDRARRYDSAGSMGRDIQRFLKGEAIEAAPPSAMYKASKFVRRHRGRVITASLLLLALVAGLIGTSLGFHNADAQRDIAEEQRDIARDEKIRADEKTEEAMAAKREYGALAYSTSMLLACSAYVDDQYALVRDSLDDAPTEHRGWEWDAINARLDTSIHEVSTSVGRPVPREMGDLFVHPDGQSFFTVRSFDVLPVRQWNADTGQLIAEFRRPTPANAEAETSSLVVMSPDGTTLTIASQVDGDEDVAVATWDLETGERAFFRVVSPGRKAIKVAALSRDGTRIAFFEYADVWLYEIASGRELASATLSVPVAQAKFNDDATRLVVADGNGAIMLLDGLSLAELSPLEGHGNIVEFEFSRDGRWLGTYSMDSSARLWDLTTTPPTSILYEHPNVVTRLRFSPDASIFATSCDDGVHRVWRSTAAELVASIPSDGVLFETLMFMPDGRTLAAQHRDGRVLFWDTDARSTVELAGHRSGLLTSTEFAGASGLIVSAGWDGWGGFPGCVRVWDAETGEQVAEVGRPGEIARYLATSPDGRRAAVTLSPRRTGDPEIDATDRRSCVLLIDLVSGQTMEIAEPASGIAFDPTGEFIALCRYGSIEIRRADGSMVRRREAGFEDSELRAPQWSPDGRYIACHDHASSANFILDAETLNVVHSAEGAVAFTHDGARLLVGSSSGDVNVLDVPSFEQAETWPDQGWRFGTMRPGGSRIAAGKNSNGDITIWDTQTAYRVARFKLPPAFVSHLDWSPDGSRLLVASGRTLILFDAVPIADRVRMREASRAAREIVEPLVKRLLNEHGDAMAVLEQIEADASLSPVQRKVARQAVLRRGLATNQ